MIANDDELGGGGRPPPATTTGELLWRLPLHPEYKELTRGTVADLTNAASKRKAGTIYAGSFLEEFVEEHDLGPPRHRRHLLGRRPRLRRQGPERLRRATPGRARTLAARRAAGRTAMNFDLSDEQRLLRETVRDFARNEVAPIAEELDRDEAVPLRDRREDGRARADGHPLPRASTAAAAPTRSPTRSRSRSSRGSTPRWRSRWPRTPRSGTMPIYLFGSEEQKQTWLPDLTSGRKLAAFGLTEPEAGSDAGNVQDAGPARGRRVGDRRRQAVHHQLRHRHLRLRLDHRGDRRDRRPAPRSRT